MKWTDLRRYCLSLDGAQETFPFRPHLSVFKAANGKIFALTAESDDPITVSVKVEPVVGEMLRGEFDAIVPGYHLNKKHWITVTLNAGVPDDRVRELVLDSYELVKPRRAARSARTATAPGTTSSR